MTDEYKKQMDMVINQFKYISRDLNVNDVDVNDVDVDTDFDDDDQVDDVFDSDEPVDRDIDNYLASVYMLQCAQFILFIFMLILQISSYLVVSSEVLNESDPLKFGHCRIGAYTIDSNKCPFTPL